MTKTTMPSIVLTRPRAAAEQFGQTLRRARPDAKVIISPIIGITFRENVPLPDADALVFTSVHGVEGYERLGGGKLPAYCVGVKTAEHARSKGLEVIKHEPDLARLEPVLMRSSYKTLLHPRGEHVTGNMAHKRDGWREAIVYDQPVLPLTDEAQAAFAGESAVVLPLFSPRSAGEVAKQISPKAPVFAAFISQAAQDRFGKTPLVRSRIVETPDAENMFNATLLLFAAACALEGHQLGD